MYCTKCGAELNPDTKICDKCESLKAQQGAAVEEKGPWRLLDRLGMLAAALCAVILLCCDWVMVPFRAIYGGLESNYSLFETGEIINVLNQFGISYVLAAIFCVVVAAALLISVVLMLIGWVSAWQKSTKWCGAGLLGALLAIFTTLFVIVSLFLLRFLLSRLYGGAMMSVGTAVPVAPWLMLLAAATYIFFDVRLLLRQKFKGCLKGIILSGVATLVILAIVGIVTTAVAVVQVMAERNENPGYPYYYEDTVPGDFFDDGFDMWFD